MRTRVRAQWAGDNLLLGKRRTGRTRGLGRLQVQPYAKVVWVVTTGTETPSHHAR